VDLERRDAAVRRRQVERDRAAARVELEGGAALAGPGGELAVEARRSGGVRLRERRRRDAQAQAVEALQHRAPAGEALDAAPEAPARVGRRPGGARDPG